MSSAKRPFDLRLTENIEAIAVSIAMALVLKFFVVEAYQIPTGSMQPTILGDREAGINDRIFADKLVTMLRPPERWEVMIFRFPLDERRLYVKRIVGLPGDTLSVQGGDIWVDGAIARKPDDVNESVLKRVFPLRGDGLDVGFAFLAKGEVQVEGETARFGGDGSGRLSLRKPPILDAYLHGYESEWNIRSVIPPVYAVPDLDVALDVTLDSRDSVFSLSMVADDLRTLFELPAEGAGTARITLAPTAGGAPERVFEVSPARGLPLGESVRLSLRNVDRRMLLCVDGEEWLRVDDDESGPHPNRPVRSDLQLAMSGAGQIEAMDVRRDIFYLPRTPHSRSTRDTWEIPEGHFMGMGDNTQNSYDGRTWQTVTYTLDDGSQFTGFDFDVGGPNGSGPSDANPRRHANGSITFADVYGDEHTFFQHEIQSETATAAPFIHQRYLMGKAVAVFWPVFDPFRWKLIR
ncbi:MAG: signal peptidase I [Planctomycetota bacterium]|nr:MAG: signal peptidase I [Planctomycetota bacterium]